MDGLVGRLQEDREALTSAINIHLEDRRRFAANPSIGHLTRKRNENIIVVGKALLEIAEGTPADYFSLVQLRNYLPAKMKILAKDTLIQYAECASGIAMKQYFTD